MRILWNLAAIVGWSYLAVNVLWTHQPFDAWFCAVIAGLGILENGLSLLVAVAGIR